MEKIDMKEVSLFVDLLEEFKTDYVDKVLERRDQMWHKRKGEFKDKSEEDMYDKTRVQGAFLEGLYLSMKSVTSMLALSQDAMEKYLGVIESMQIAPDGKFRDTLFTEQRDELNKVNEHIKKIYDYNTTTYEEIKK